MRVPRATPSSRCRRALALRRRSCPAYLGLFQRGVGRVCRWPRLPPAVVFASFGPVVCVFVRGVVAWPSPVLLSPFFWFLGHGLIR